MQRIACPALAVVVLMLNPILSNAASEWVKCKSYALNSTHKQVAIYDILFAIKVTGNKSVVILSPGNNIRMVLRPDPGINYVFDNSRRFAHYVGLISPNDKATFKKCVR